MLNSEQKKAVLASKGKVLVLAGAGSGKTSVLACRIAHLIQELSVSPKSILGLTFTNKAAEEMRERVGRFTNPKIAKEVTLCTFHSFCMQVLRQEIHKLGFTSNFTLYDEKDVKRVLTQIVRHSLEHEGDLPSLQGTLAKITEAKNHGLSSLAETEDKDSSWHSEFSKDLLQKLQTCMRSYNAVDFDSLLTLTVQLFNEHPDVLEQYQERFQYIMIDEYQDTNPIQYKLAELLSRKYGNLCVVGDDDQSIYGWRGAEVKHILEFPAQTKVKLEQNYRSSPNILEGANRVISNNVERHSKSLWSEKSFNEPLFLFHAPNEIEEALAVVQRIIYLKKHKSLKWKDIAILYRSNALSQTFETALLQASYEEDGKWKRGIPYEVFGGTEFYERAEIKDTLSYLRVVANPLDQEALLRILNVPRRGISDTCLDALTQYNRKEGIPLWEVLKSVTLSTFPLQESLSKKAIAGIQSFFQIIEEAKTQIEHKKPLHEMLTWLVDKVDYKKAIKEDVKSEKMREFKWDNVGQCIEALNQYAQKNPEEGSLSDFLSSTLLSSADHPKSSKHEKEDKVNLMTIHSSKGLEFEACFLVCLEDHIMPHEKSVASSGIEEERRLMYVAMTRAKRYLTLSMARDRKKMGKQIQTTPSRFLFEIPKEILKISSYQTVEM